MKIVKVENLYKKFSCDVNPITMFNIAKRIIRPKKHYVELWALKDINFEAMAGDRVGIIGDNGSGKTTLLKIIAGLYKKTDGSVYVNGKISAFLQLGIGMERDLSALENIFLFGAIMGLKRNFIREKLTEIIEFAEIENFINHPLRDLSTGIVQRIAFSITCFIKTDLLILDEILSSGDHNFKEKCYKKFSDYVNTSKTIIVATHEMEIIRMLCNKVLLLSEGRQAAFGNPEDIINKYEKLSLK